MLKNGRRKNGDFAEKRTKDKEIYIRQHYEAHIVCERNEKTSEFKEWSLKGERKKGNSSVYIFSRTPRKCLKRTHECLETMGRKNSSPAVALFFFHISLNKLWSHFLIHWIGDNLLLLLTSLGPTIDSLVSKWSFYALHPHTCLCFMGQIKLTDFDLSIVLLTNGFMIVMVTGPLAQCVVFTI